MSVIKVDAASHSYDVFVDEFTLDQLGEVCRDVSGGDACCIISCTPNDLVFSIILDINKVCMPP